MSVCLRSPGAYLRATINEGNSDFSGQGADAIGGFEKAISLINEIVRCKTLRVKFELGAGMTDSTIDINDAFAESGFNINTRPVQACGGWQVTKLNPDDPAMATSVYLATQPTFIFQDPDDDLWYLLGAGGTSPNDIFATGPDDNQFTVTTFPQFGITTVAGDVTWGVGNSKFLSEDTDGTIKLKVTGTW